MKGNMKGECDTFIYKEILFIFIPEKVSKYLLYGGAKLLNNQTKNNIIFIIQTWASNSKDNLNANMFTEWQPGSVNYC